MPKKWVLLGALIAQRHSFNLHADPEWKVDFFGFGNGTSAGMSEDAFTGLKSILEGEDLSGGIPVKLAEHLGRQKDLNAHSCDRTKLGVSAKILSEIEWQQIKMRGSQSSSLLSEAAIAYRAVYDTSEFGKSNTGHSYGDAMNDSERMAVIEFLKLM